MSRFIGDLELRKNKRLTKYLTRSNFQIKKQRCEEAIKSCYELNWINFGLMISSKPFNRQPHKMVKRAENIRRLLLILLNVSMTMEPAPCKCLVYFAETYLKACKI